MSKRVRFLILIVVLVVSGSFLYPTFRWYFLIGRDDKELASGSKQQIRDYSQKKASEDLNILKGKVKSDPEALIPENMSFIVDTAKRNYKLAEKPFPVQWNIKSVLEGFRTEKEIFDVIESQYLQEILSLKEYHDNVLQLGLDLSGGMNVVLEADMKSLAQRLGHEPTEADKKSAMDRAMEILNNRIDKFGVTEPQIRRQGTEEITIEIPGAADPERVRSFLMGKGRLNFHIVNDEATTKLQEYMASNPSAAISSGDDLELPPGFLDAGLAVRGFYKKDKYGIDQRIRYLVITEEAGLDGNHIKDAQVGSDPITGQPVINFSLDREGGEIFFKLTSANVNKTLAIVLDDKIKAGARISEPIRDSVRMTGFDKKEAGDLAIVLRTAAMPVDLKVMSQQAIGATLGEDSIRIGLRAITLGFLLVIGFMLIYYLGAGINAVVAQILNLYLMIAVLSAFNLTLTLTSIAGFVLTIGMAVDANVIIFERIKEEYRLGKSIEASVKAGFRKAFWTIMDSNITTFIAAIFLSQLGTGPIQGFAYTLAVGIVTSMFTALFVSRLMFDFNIEVRKIKKLSISWRPR
ncbi:MAG: protein translocase subunit SecD [Spirochaetota bacterium]